MSFRLKKDTDSTWVTGDFGSGPEKYKISYYSPEIIIELMKKYGHRDSYFWKHKETNVEVSEKPEDIDNYDQLEKVYVENEYDVTDEKALKLRQESICRVILDWDESIQDENGKPVNCGEQEKKQLVLDSFARITWILLKARNLLTFLPDMEQVVKNSKRLSNTEKTSETAESNSRHASVVSR